MILISGIHSGIGKYLHEILGGIPITRNTPIEEFNNIKKEGVDIIIHCAFNSRKEVNSETLFEYFEDNVLLTKRLVNIPHYKFIFFSTVDLYPKNDNVHLEDEVIKLDVACGVPPDENIKGIYATTKLLSESIVKDKCDNYLILRPTLLLGKYTRRNTLIRIMEGEEKIYLSGNSVYNYVLYSDVLNFIRFSITNDLYGTFNVASIDNLFLSEACAVIGKTVTFGNIRFEVGNISNHKISSLFPAFKKTSKEVLSQFVSEWKRFK